MEEYLGNHEEAIRLAKENIQDDPLGRNGLGILSTLLSNEGRFDEALVYANKNLKHSQSESQSGGWYGRVWNPHYLVMRIYLQQGKSEDALTEANKIIDHELRTFCHALIYPTTQNKKEADLALEGFLGKYKDTNTFNIAEIYANRGEIDKAFAWLEKAFVKRDTEMRWLNTSPWLKKIHNDNRYDAMLAKVKLPKL